MVTIGTAQRSDVGNWGLAHGLARAQTSSEAPKISPTKIESYDDPKKDYGFLVAVSIGDSRQENWFHPSHPILSRLKKRKF